MTFGQKLSKFSINTFIRIFLCLLCLTVLYPLFWNLMSSFKSNQEFFTNPWALPHELFQPGNNIFQNYINVWAITGLSVPFMNSLWVSAISLVGSIVLTPIYVLCNAWLGGNYTGAHLIIYGLVIVLILLYLPGGLLSLFDIWGEKLEKKKAAKAAAKNGGDVNG